MTPVFLPFTVSQPAPTALKLVGVIINEEEQDALTPPFVPKHCQRKFVSLSTMSENEPVEQVSFAGPQTPLTSLVIEHEALEPPFKP